MHFGNFSFGSVQINGEMYEHDVVIDRGEITNARKGLRKNSVSISDTRHYFSMNKSHGNAVNLSSAQVRMAEYTAAAWA